MKKLNLSLPDDISLVTESDIDTSVASVAMDTSVDESCDFVDSPVDVKMPDVVASAVVIVNGFKVCEPVATAFFAVTMVTSLGLFKDACSVVSKAVGDLDCSVAASAVAAGDLFILVVVSIFASGDMYVSIIASVVAEGNTYDSVVASIVADGDTYGSAVAFTVSDRDIYGSAVAFTVADGDTYGSAITSIVTDGDTCGSALAFTVADGDTYGSAVASIVADGDTYGSAVANSFSMCIGEVAFTFASAEVIVSLETNCRLTRINMKTDILSIAFKSSLATVHCQIFLLNCYELNKF